MTTSMQTIKPTTAQAMVRWLANQFFEIDGQKMHLCGGEFDIFGHGYVTVFDEVVRRAKHRRGV